MFKKLIIIVFAMTMHAVVFQGYACAVTIGTESGTYDFGGLGANNSAWTGYAKLGDKFKVGNDLFSAWSSVITGQDTVISPDNATTSPYTAVIKAEGADICKTFTFVDLGISATWPRQKFDSFVIEFKDIEGKLIYTNNLGPSGVYPRTEMTSIRNLFSSKPLWPVAGVPGVASIEITYTISTTETIGGIEIPEGAFSLNFENISISNVDNSAFVPSIFRITPSSGPTSGGTSVTIIGTDFTGASAVKFGGTDALSFTLDPESDIIIAVTPYFSSSSTVNTTVTVSGVNSTTGVADEFTYNNATGAEDGTYDFGSLGAADSAGVGYARLGDKFKVRNDLFIQWRNINTGPITAINPHSNTTQLYTAVIKAEGGTTCRTFTFKDLGISATSISQKFDTLDIVLKDINGDQIGSPISLGSSPVYSQTSVINVSELYSQGPWSVQGVAAIEIIYSISADSSPINAWDLNLENISVADVTGKSSQTITFGPVPFVAGGIATVSATATSELPITFTSTTSDVCTVSGANVSVLTAGSCIIAANQGGNADYLAAPQVTQDLGKLNQSIAFGPVPSTIIVGGNGTVDATSTSGLTSITFSSVTPTFCSINGTTVTGIKVGTCIIAADQIGDASYNPAPQVTQSFGIGIGSQTISFTAPANKIYGDAEITLTAVATSNLPVSFTLVSGPATLTDGNKLTITGVGNIELKGTQAGNANYSAATDVPQTITVAAKPLIVTSNDTSRAFSAANPAIPGFTAPALVAGDAISGVTYSYAATADATAAVGTTHTITPSVAIFSSGDASNYNITYTAGTLTIAGTAVQSISFSAPANKIYGDAPLTLTATATSALPVSFTLVSGPASLTGDTLTITGVGSIVVRGTQSGDINYSAASDVLQTIVVKANQAITFDNPGTQTFGKNLSLSALASSGLVPTFSSLTSGVCTVTAEGSLAFVTTGTCNIAVNQDGDASYLSAAQVTQLFTVNKASQSITFTVPANKIYGDSPITLSATATSILPVSFALVSGPAALSGTTLTITGAGSIVVKATQSGDSNYSSAPDVAQTITVAARALTITANDAGRAYGAPNPAIPGFTAPALVGGDAISGVTYTYPGTATEIANVGTIHSITPSAAVFTSGAAANYAITYATGTLTIAGTASQSISFTAPANKIYGDAPVTLSATATSGLPVSFTHVSGPATLVGTTLTITGTGSIVVRATQSGDSNYSSAPDVAQTITVAARALTITANDSGRAYGATNPATPGFTAPALVGGDAITGVTYTYPGTATATANVGTTHSITPSAAVFTSGAAANYAITYAAGTLTIAGTASQSISFTAPANKIYGDAPVTLSATATSSLPVSFTVSGPASLVGTTLTITGAGSIVVTATQSGDSNYSSAPDVAQAITVAARALTITANDAGRAYGAANLATPGFTAPALVGGDAITGVTYTYPGTATATANVGTTHSITPSAAVFTSGAAANYSITYTAGTLTIAGTASQSISFTAPANKIYGDSPITLSATATSGLPVLFTHVSGPATLVGTTLTTTGAGSIVITATQSGDSNYSSAPDVTQAITVTRSPVGLRDALNAYHIYLGMNLPTATDLIRFDLAPLDANGKPKGNGKIDIGDVVFILRNILE